MDFMTPAQAQAVRARTGTVEVTDALNKAFEAGQASGRTVYLPDGLYIVGNLLFGSQNQKGQSAAPLGLQGQSKMGAVLRARPGLRGTLLQSWSLAGVTFSDFSIETTGTDAQAWDCQWKPGPGPSTQNVIRHIMVTGGTAPLHVNWDNLNDTYPTAVTVRVDDPAAASCGISMVQSGGLSLMRECIWANCYLRFGTQNGKIDGCWGHGIEFAANSLNHVEISAGYLYANPTHRAVLWSQSYQAFQSVRALICIATQFVTETPGAAAYFELNAYSEMRFLGCQWIGLTKPLLGKRSLSDSYANVLVKIEGGTHSGNLELNENPRFEIECEGFMNFATGRMVTKNRGGTFVPIIRGAGAAAAPYTSGSKTFGRYHRSGNLVRFKMRLEWSAHAGAGSRSRLQIAGLPLAYDPESIDSVSLEYSGTTFAGKHVLPQIANGVIDFLATDGSTVTLPKSGDLILSGSYTVLA
ncbi:pectate lyase family protein [Sphingomonas hengshuiensis]|uniref:Pectate lyase superfamily protein domain-containing protein n=1 Tax=Sphingomonas hengshuiensis TaxID=1609977 RepID=A0A7U5BGD4_9SPHN|nr:hypothetical protein [Sphingomonas hengshuiensis]AJP74783.1 hypothetical protein TS85_23675 [Sphingomonas hengshuiensis]